MSMMRLVFVTDAPASKRRPTAISVGCSHDRYSHQAGLSPATRAELSRDFA